jgi:DNA-binding transcriptional LysR family regulator
VEWSPQELRLLAAVARCGSFRGAAGSLGIAPSSASHVVRRLEERIGVRLLHRTTRSVALTVAGERLLKRASVAMAAIDAALVEAAEAGDRVSGTLRISAPTTAVHLLLKEVIPLYHRRYPDVDVELRAEDRTVDIVADGCDAGIRLRYAVPIDMIVVPFGPPVRFIVVGTPDYLAHAGIPQHPDDLAQHRCIRTRLPSGALYNWQFERDGEERTVQVSGRLTVDRAELMVDAALSGAGLAYVMESLAAAALAEKRLVPVLANWCAAEPGLCLYYPGHRQPPPALRALIDLVRDKLCGS